MVDNRYVPLHHLTHPPVIGTTHQVPGTVSGTNPKPTLQISELHTKYLAQSRELDEAEKLAQSSNNLRTMIERLNGEREELSRELRETALDKAAAEAEVGAGGDVTS